MKPVSPNHSPTVVAVVVVVVVVVVVPFPPCLAKNFQTNQTRGANVAQTLRALEPFVEQVTARLGKLVERKLGVGFTYLFFDLHPYFGKIPIWTNILQMG